MARDVLPDKQAETIVKNIAERMLNASEEPKFNESERRLYRLSRSKAEIYMSSRVVSQEKIYFVNA